MVLKRFRIQARQIVSFTSDNGSNYILAGKLLSDECDDGEIGQTAEEPEEVVIEEAEDDPTWIDARLELNQDEFKITSVRRAEHTTTCCGRTCEKGTRDSTNHKGSEKSLQIPAEVETSSTAPQQYVTPYCLHSLRQHL